MILCSNPLAEYTAEKQKIDAAILRVLVSGRYILGEETSTFEAEFATYLNVAHAVGLGSGTEALHLALRACGIGPGDEVITVSHSAVATVAAIELAGATPVLIDIEPDCYAMAPEQLPGAISARTRAVIPVHLYGHPVDMSHISRIARESGLRIIEDCAQAHGALFADRKVGSLGDIGCFSFYPTKNLGALGDGGAAVTNDPSLARALVRLRQYGWSERYVSETPGSNSRLDELQAAVLRVKLGALERGNARRRSLARRYDEELEDLDIVLPRRRSDASHVFHLYVVRVQDRARFLDHLRRNDIAALVHYPVPIHLQPAYSGRVACAGPMTETERVAGQVVSLPIYPALTDGEQEHVIKTIRGYYGRGHR